VFLELINPKFVDIYASTDRLKIRIRETNAPGRLWINLTFRDIDSAKATIRKIQEALDAGPKQYTGKTPKQIGDVQEN
jgi:hypothetical protein